MDAWASRSVAPWVANSYRLVGWWDMEQFSAAAVYQIAGSFEGLRMKYGLVERFGKATLSEGGIQSVELLTAQTPLDLDTAEISALISIFESVCRLCQGIGLGVAVQTARDYITELKGGRLRTNGHAAHAISTLDKIISVQLRDNLFMFIPNERANFYAKPELFGASVNSRFPSCQYDIEEAGNCYAAGRGTACAFHLMRVMEGALQDFGTKLGISLADEKVWQVILDGVNKAVQALPPREPRTVAVSQVAGHLYNVKIAWRNPTMHPKAVYTLQEAADLLQAVRSFLKELADVI